MEEIYIKIDMINDIELRLSFVKDLLSEESEFFAQTFLTSYINYERKRLNYYCVQKNHFINVDDFEMVSQYRKLLSETKKYIQKLNNFLNSSDLIEEKNNLNDNDFMDFNLSFQNLKKVSGKKEISNEEVFGEVKNLNDNQVSYIQKIVDGTYFDIKEEELDDLITSIKMVINNYSFLDNYDSIKRIIDKILDLDIDLSLKDIYWYSIIDTLKIKKKKLEKNEKLEKRKINDFISKLENELLISDTSFFDLEQNLDYEVIEYALNNVIPYYYLKRIVSLKPELLSLEKDGHSVMFLILEKYIESQKIELRNHSHDYIPKEYYKNFYNLIMEVLESNVSSKVQDEISTLVLEFDSYLKASGYKQENKNNAMFLFHQLVDGSSQVNVSSCD